MLTLKSQTLPPDQRKARNSYVRAAGSFVPKLTAKVFEKYGFHSAEIMTSWSQVVGADVAAITVPERIKWPRATSQRGGDDTEAAAQGGATLILRVEPAHALDIEYRLREIADRINRYFGYRAIATVKIVQAPLTQNSAETAQATPRPLPTEIPVNLTELAEDGLKSALTGLWASIAAESARR